jgi:hypothetical protein
MKMLAGRRMSSPRPCRDSSQQCQADWDLPDRVEQKQREDARIRVVEASVCLYTGFW